ncbi:MAG: hypothetical protein HGA37_07480, partial [Lentimicrobium sp.]|nr:hypothetical protein [Lentimicrobium sp.]
HISNDDGVVKFSTLFTDGGMKLRLIFVPALTSKEKIIVQLNQPEMNVHMSDGKTQVIKNPYKF